jgi:hypothetical protein
MSEQYNFFDDVDYGYGGNYNNDEDYDYNSLFTDDGIIKPKKKFTGKFPFQKKNSDSFDMQNANFMDYINLGDENKFQDDQFSGNDLFGFNNTDEETENYLSPAVGSSYSPISPNKKVDNAFIRNRAEKLNTGGAPLNPYEGDLKESRNSINPQTYINPSAPNNKTSNYRSLY